MREINYQELRERYSPQPVPKCRICGDEMTVQHICGRHITYGCTGATYDDKGCYYAEGRSIADDHYGLSRVTVIDVSDPEVLALLDELERNQQYIKRRDQENEDIALTVGKLRVELEAVQKTSAARIEAIDRTHKMFQREKDRADAAEKCIAELSASHSKLRDTMAGIHNTIRMDGGYTPLAAILNAAKRAYEESASAAGIRIKGE
ncbi:ead/Ea22-like family protein [Escherichia coli]